MQDFREAGKVVELEDSNHTDVCKPTNKHHRAYREFLKFVEDILEQPEVWWLILINEPVLSGLPFDILDLGLLETRYTLCTLLCWHSTADILEYL